MKIAEMKVRGVWNIPVSVSKCMCPDGKRRFVKLTGHADTWFSIPAKVTFKGKSVTGYVTGTEADDGRPDYKFIPYLYGKNGKLFGEEPWKN